MSRQLRWAFGGGGSSTGNDYNREAFDTARGATVAPTFYEARAILSEIVPDRIGDPDVAKYVKFCIDLSKFCIEHGIQRSADLNFWSVLATADKSTAVGTAIDLWRRKGPYGPLLSLLEGGSLAVRLKGWFKLQEELAARYS